MADGLIEIRNYFRKWNGNEDYIAGITQPLRLPTGPAVNGQQPFDLFVPVGFQYRYKRTVFLNGAKTTEWSEWQAVPVVREGYDDAPEIAAGAPPHALTDA